jgi:hypothetical protein
MAFELNVIFCLCSEDDAQANCRSYNIFLSRNPLLGEVTIAHVLLYGTVEILTVPL